MTEAIPTSINGRWTLLLPEHRAARPEWGWWEAQRLAAMHHVIRPGDRIFDVGAEEGDFPALWATWGARVTCFEPNPLVWPNIRFIFEANDLVTPDWFCGFAADGSSHSWRRHSSACGSVWPDSAFGPVIGDHGFQTIPEYPDTPRVTVDDWCAATGQVPDVVTMDVEGAELRVLRGAVETLRAHRPVVFVSVHPEFMAETYGDSADALHALMADLGFESRFLCRDHEEHWIWAHPEGRAFP